MELHRLSLGLVLTCLMSLSAVAVETRKIVIIGDSLTEGYGVSRERAYPALVQKRANSENKGWTVINAGVSGSTTASALSRVEWQLKQKPALLVLALGANDGLRGIAVRTSEQNLSSALSAAKKANVKTLLVGMKLPPNYGAAYTRDFEQMFLRLAKKHSVKLLPFLLENVGGKAELNLPDGIHPNEKGHEILSNSVYGFLSENL